MINFTPLFFPKPKLKGFTHKLLLSAALITVSPTVQAMYQDDDPHSTQHTSVVLVSPQEDLGDDAHYAAGFEDIEYIDRLCWYHISNIENKAELTQSIGLLLRHRKRCGYPDIDPKLKIWDSESNSPSDSTPIGLLIDVFSGGNKHFLSFAQSVIELLSPNDTHLRHEQIANCLIMLRKDNRDPSTYAYYINAVEHLLEGNNDVRASITQSFIWMLSAIEESMPDIPKEKVLEMVKKLKPNRDQSHESVFRAKGPLHNLQSEELFIILQVLGQTSQTLDDQEYVARLQRLRVLNHTFNLSDYLGILAPEILEGLKVVTLLRLFSPIAHRE